MILILNHKANLTFEEIKEYEKKLRKYNVIVMPSNCYLSLFQKGKYILASQDISEFNDTNVSGEINGKQLKSLNVKYCLIGHSNRRILLKETNATIKNKLNECLKNNLIPICCIGELNDVDELKTQIDLYLNILKDREFYIVYEPVNNIGKSNPNLSNVKTNIKFIKEYIKDNYNLEVNIIYGGGVNINDLDELCNIEEIDGLIICTDALNFNDLKSIIEKTN